MILFFYNLALLMALVAGAPWWLWRMATTQKYREGLRERLGTVPPGLGELGRQTARSSGCMPSRSARCWPSAVWSGNWIAISRVPGRDFHHHPHRPGAGPRALWAPTASSIARSICPGRLRAYLNALAAEAADPGRDRVLAQPAERLLSGAEFPWPWSTRASPTARGRATGCCAGFGGRF